MPGWLQAQKFSLPNISLFCVKAVKDTDHHLITHWHSPPLFPFPYSLCLDLSGLWTSSSCASCTLKISVTTIKAAENCTQEHNGDINKFLYFHCIYNRGTQNKQTWDVWTWESFMMWQQLKKLPKQDVVGLHLFYTAFLSYPVAPTFFLCSMSYQTDGWSAATKQVLCGSEAGKKNLWHQSAHSYVQLFFLFSWASLSDHCQREHRGPAQRVPWEDAVLCCAHSGRAERTACSLSHP